MALSPLNPSGDERGPPPRTSQNIAWACELIDRLKTLWQENRLTTSQMAGRLGISKNALIGKAHRLGLATHKAKSAKPIARKPIPKAKKLPPVMPILDEPAPSEPEFVGVGLLELEAWSCRYPQGDHVPYRFCGAPKRDGSSYCPHHHRVAYQPLSRRPTFIPAPWADHRGRR
jgi:GcrA cell cycle regulator